MQSSPDNAWARLAVVPIASGLIGVGCWSTAVGPPVADTGDLVAPDVAATETPSSCGPHACPHEGGCVPFGDQTASDCQVCGAAGVFEPCPAGCTATGTCRRVTHIDAGEAHACALTDDGEVWCWGNGRHGGLGFGAIHRQAMHGPGRVQDLAPVRELSVGARHTCVIDRDRAIFCWGDNDFDHVSPGGPGWTSTPQQVGDLFDPRLIAAGRWRTCVVRFRSVHCWGLKLGAPLDDDGWPLEPAAVDDGVVEIVQLQQDIVDIAAGMDRMCVTTLDAEVLCWGDNTDNALGIGVQTTLATTPTAVAELDIAAKRTVLGWGHQCATAADNAPPAGGLACWGNTAAGQAGVSDETLEVPLTITPAFSEPVTSACAGADFTCAVTASGRVRCIGANKDATLGVASPTETVIPRGPELPPAVVVGCGRRHACAADRSGAIHCWGGNDDGQLGTGQAGPPSPEPHRLTFLPGGS